jgi:hemoglobin-like flavoprotein
MNPIDLTTHQVVLLKNSLRLTNTEKLATEFYGALFSKYPQVKHLFPTDMKELGIKLMSVFELVIYSFEEKKTNRFSLQEELIKPMQELGKQHEAKGVMPDHYLIANDLLLEILAKENETLFTDEVKMSWKLALEHLTIAMLSKQPVNANHSDGRTLREIFNAIVKNVIKK